jgi:hypothetical protein
MPVEYIMHVLSEVLPEDAMLADESASSEAKFHRYVRPIRPGGYSYLRRRGALVLSVSFGQAQAR